MNNDEVRMIISRAIQEIIKKKNTTVKELVYYLHCSEEYIKKLIARENVGIGTDFLQRLVVYCGLVSYRIRGYEETEDTYSFDTCVKLLESLYSVPPRQRSLWDEEND